MCDIDLEKCDKAGIGLSHISMTVKQDNGVTGCPQRASGGFKSVLLSAFTDFEVIAVLVTICRTLGLTELAANVVIVIVEVRTRDDC